jgi:dinuclear metal center YbgI/SA1388 family protein
MSIELKDLLRTCEELWPLAGAESWDSPGLVSGNLNQSISKVLLSVDVTLEILEEAQAENCGLVLSHHPVLFRPVSSISQNSAKGLLLAQAISSNIAIYSAHTNADVVVNGVSDILAKHLGIKAARPLSFGATSSSDSANNEPSTGHGRIGEILEPMKLGDFARAIARVLPATASGVRVAGDFNQLVRKIAVCGGAGDEFISNAQEQGADVYITSDLRHHITQEAREESKARKQPMALIDVSHWASEWLWLNQAAEQLRARHQGLEVLVSDLRTDPWDFVVTQ